MLDTHTIPYWNTTHLALHHEIRNFIDTHVRPRWFPLDNDERFPWIVRTLAAEAGLAGIDISVADGGRGLDFVSQGIAYEESGRLDVNARELIGSGHGRLIACYGTATMKQRWLPSILRGQTLVGIGITEEHTGSDIRALRTTAHQSDTGYRINGKKAYVSRIHEAKAFIVLARTQRDEHEHTLSAFVVDVQQPGIIREDIEPLGLKGWSYGSIALNDIEVPHTALLSEEGQGFAIFEEHFSYWRILMALACLGAAQASLAECIVYAKERTAFNKPLGHFSPVMYTISEHASKIYAARLLCYQALWLKDCGQSYVAEAAMSKWFGTQVAFDAVDAALQIFGARGYTTDFPLEKRLRDIRGLMIADGTNDIMKLLVGRELFGKEFYNKSLGRDN